MNDVIREWLIQNGRRFVELKILSGMESSADKVIIFKSRRYYQLTDSEWSDLLQLIGQIDALTWAFDSPDLITELNNIIMLMEVEVLALQEKFETKRILRGKA